MLDKALSFIKSLGAGNTHQYKGSYAGVPFLVVDSATLSGGHRVVRHEYPLRDKGYSENMGRLMRTWSVNVLVIGDNHLEQRDRLIEVLEAPEPAELVHPYYGTEFVQIESFSCTDSEAHGGVSFFAISYTEATREESPVVMDNGLALLSDAKGSFIDGLIDDFVAAWELFESGVEFTESVIEFTDNVMTGITNIIRGLSGGNAVGLIGKALALKASVKSLVDSPRKLASELTGLLSSFRDSENDNARQALYSVVSDVRRNSSTASNETDAPRGNTPENVIETLIISAAIAEISDIVLSETQQTVRQSAESTTQAATQQKAPQTTETLEDCEKAIVNVNKELTDIMIKTGDLYWYTSAHRCNALRQVFTEEMQLLSASLPAAIKITLMRTEPALVALYRATGDCKTVKRFCTRNGVIHPIFVRGGRHYEVIDDAK